jgi:hypothetical protein
MQPSLADLDPEGLYARLGVQPSASARDIAAAFRQKARVLHPDVAGTGNAAAFVAAREAYDVLANPERRAAYDRNARQAALESAEVGEIEPDPPPIMPAAPMRHPRLSDLPLGLWIGAALLICVGIVEAVVHLSRDGAPSRPVTPGPGLMVSPQPAPAAKPNPEPESKQAEPLQLAGTPNFYIVPAPGPATLWRHDTNGNSFVPAGQLPPFSTVQALRLFRENGLVEVRVTDHTTGLVEAARLAPGDASAARRAYCAYYAGPPPDNGEVLERHASGPGSLEVTNRTSQPIVMKLRGPEGSVAVSVFLAPGGYVTVRGLPDGLFRPDFAIGELWSRACNGFAAGMRALRFPEAVPLTSLNPLALPPDDTTPGNISDRQFEGE